MQLQEIEHLNRALIDYAVSVYPLEACGLIVKTQSGYEFVEIKNIHDSPHDNFAISSNDYARASIRGEIAAIFHSHVDASIYNGKFDFSEADRVACEQLGIPWVLAVLPTQEIKINKPSGYRLPLLGREFSYGVVDCYGLIRDAYADIGIKLYNYKRGKLYEWNDDPTWNLYEDYFKQEGFVEIDMGSNLRKYDLLLMKIQSDKINHGALMWEPDKNIFIHHLVDRLSELSVFGGYWRQITVKICRHEKLWNI